MDCFKIGYLSRSEVGNDWLAQADDYNSKPNHGVVFQPLDWVELAVDQDGHHAQDAQHQRGNHGQLVGLEPDGTPHQSGRLKKLCCVYHHSLLFRCPNNSRDVAYMATAKQ